MQSQWTILLAGVVLLAAIGAVVYLRAPSASLVGPQPQSDHLRRLFSNQTSIATFDWFDTEQTRRILGANEIVYLRCREANASYELYVARWSAGNINCSQATEHPPDLCWPGNGWRCVAAQSNVSIGSVGPVEWRRFERAIGAPEEVIFWCMEGSRQVALGHRKRDPKTAGTTNPEATGNLITRSFFLNFWFGWFGLESLHPWLATRLETPSRHDVYFVRINSPHQLEGVLSTGSLSLLLTKLGTLGILPSQPRSHDSRSAAQTESQQIDHKSAGETPWPISKSHQREPQKR